MIINKEFDNSICYILKGSKKLRKKVVTFIDEMPEEFLNNIRVAVAMRKAGMYVYDHIPSEFFHVKDPNDERIEWGFLLETGENGELDIFKRANGRIVFELALPPLGAKQLARITKGYNAWAGSVHDCVEPGRSMFDPDAIRLNEYNHSLDNYAIGRFISCQRFTYGEPNRTTTFKRISKKEPKEIVFDSEAVKIRKMKQNKGGINNGN